MLPLTRPSVNTTKVIEIKKKADAELRGDAGIFFSIAARRWDAIWFIQPYKVATDAVTPYQNGPEEVLQRLWINVGERLCDLLPFDLQSDLNTAIYRERIPTFGETSLQNAAISGRGNTMSRGLSSSI